MGFFNSKKNVKYLQCSILEYFISTLVATRVLILSTCRTTMWWMVHVFKSKYMCVLIDLINKLSVVSAWICAIRVWMWEIKVRHVYGYDILGAYSNSIEQCRYVFSNRLEKHLEPCAVWTLRLVPVCVSPVCVRRGKSASPPLSCAWGETIRLGLKKGTPSWYTPSCDCFQVFQ